jgi:hypothetical protein
MADVISVFTMLVLFSACLLYTQGCSRLKGSRP